ncbi:RxLR-like protein [Plasmopara halstedii]|uniref:RxLR-like protein n=1 Tax=Plasmopara halstedii TaxID=4781 RepID=A0A0P1A707_PLAHL|nr:RxLR-like protein [Plasmopara halstedii]CEG36006.1 RxLR-like protein [Plasmopara halstedii]|eukprot:XP_024572375.1 RxLR-like protein [Plasmopara halstedii]
MIQFSILLHALFGIVLRASTVLSGTSFPGVEYNVVVGEPAHASSYYNFVPNVLYDTQYVPSNANDGFSDATSWWSAGDDATEQVFWQVNMSSWAPSITRMVVRWHGFLSPKTYRIRVSYDGREFTSVLAFANLSNAYDRVDNHTEGFGRLISKFKYIRIVMDDPNVCGDQFSCVDDGISERTIDTNERVLYGIREVEVWAKGRRNGATSKWRFSIKFLVVFMMVVI